MSELRQSRCPPGDVLCAWIDGELPAAEAGAVAAHVGACAVCSEESAGLKRVRGQLRSLPPRRLPAGLVEQVPVLAGGGDAHELPPHGRARAERLSIAAAALLFAVAGALAWGGRDEPPRMVEVPVHEFVSDHALRTTAGPFLSPAAFEE